LIGKWGVIALRAAVLLIGAGLLVFGVLRGETTDILRKAVFVCLECIGIG